MVDPDQIACFQGETPEEVAGLAEALQSQVVRVNTPYDGEQSEALLLFPTHQLAVEAHSRKMWWNEMSQCTFLFAM